MSLRPPIERSHREGKEDQGQIGTWYPGGKEESAFDNPSDERLELEARQSSRRPVCRDMVFIHPWGFQKQIHHGLPYTEKVYPGNMPLTWRLPIYAFDENTRNRMRLVAMQVGQDPNIEGFSLTQDPDEATKHWLTVEFVEGFDRPEQNAIRYLDHYLKLLSPPLPASLPPRKSRWQRLLAEPLDIEDPDGV